MSTLPLQLLLELYILPSDLFICNCFLTFTLYHQICYFTIIVFWSIPFKIGFVSLQLLLDLYIQPSDLFLYTCFLTFAFYHQIWVFFCNSFLNFLFYHQICSLAIASWPVHSTIRFVFFTVVSWATAIHSTIGFVPLQLLLDHQMCSSANTSWPVHSTIRFVLW